MSVDHAVKPNKRIAAAVAGLAGASVVLAATADLLGYWNTSKSYQPLALGLLVIVGCTLGVATYKGVDWAQTEIARLRQDRALADKQTTALHCLKRAGEELQLAMVAALSQHGPFGEDWRAALVETGSREFIVGCAGRQGALPATTKWQTSATVLPTEAVVDGLRVLELATPTDQRWQVCIQATYPHDPQSATRRRAAVNQARDTVVSSQVLSTEFLRLWDARNDLATARATLDSVAA